MKRKLERNGWNKFIGVFFTEGKILKYVDRKLSTGCIPIDDLLGGGIDRGSITQLYGAPASGKTNIALSAAAETVAEDKKVVYIDTEGISIDRFHQLVREKGDPYELGENLIISEVHNFEEQSAAIKRVVEFAADVDLIVLDSATGFYRLEQAERADGGALRTLARQMISLLSLARRFDLAVIVTNQVYTDPETNQIRPLGGNILPHWNGTVLRLDRFRGGNRKITIEKHRSRPAGESARFVIKENILAGGDEWQVLN